MKLTLSTSKIESIHGPYLENPQDSLYRLNICYPEDVIYRIKGNKESLENLLKDITHSFQWVTLEVNEDFEII